MSDDLRSNWVVDPAHSIQMRLDLIEKYRTNGDGLAVILEAEELLNIQPDHSAGLLYLAEALHQTGDAETALRTYNHYLATVHSPSAEVLCGLAAAQYDNCQLEAARDSAREAIRLAPAQGRGHYLLGLTLEHLPNCSAESIAAFTAARQLDPDAHPFPLQLTKEDWERCIQQALVVLPEEIRQFWEGLPVHLYEWPDIEELTAADPPISPRVAGLYLGTPPLQNDVQDTRPSGLRLFTRSISRCLTMDEVVERIAATLHREALDWLGSPFDSLFSDKQ